MEWASFDIDVPRRVVQAVIIRPVHGWPSGARSRPPVAGHRKMAGKSRSRRAPDRLAAPKSGHRHGWRQTDAVVWLSITMRGSGRLSRKGDRGRRGDGVMEKGTGSARRRASRKAQGRPPRAGPVGPGAYHERAGRSLSATAPPSLGGSSIHANFDPPPPIAANCDINPASPSHSPRQAP